MSVRLRFTLAGSAVLATALLFACNTTSSSDDKETATISFDVAENTLIYDGTVHTPGTKGARVQATPALLAVEQTLTSGDTVLAVNLGMSPVVSGDYALANHSVFPTDKASVSVWGLSVGSTVDTAKRVRVTVYANGDSIQVIGKDIALDNGKKASFNIRTCTSQATCRSPRVPAPAAPAAATPAKVDATKPAATEGSTPVK